MQSVDGDTAQVPPQIAEELGIDHIAYAKGARDGAGARGPPDRRRGHRGRPAAPLAGPRHRDRLHGPALPLLRADARRPRAPSSTSGTRPRWTPTPTRIGLKGSWTQVYRLFSPSEDRPKTCEYIRNPSELIGKIAARYQQAAPGAEVDDRGRLRARRQGAHLPRRVLGLRRARGRRRPLRLAGAAGQGPPARRQPGRAASAPSSPATTRATGPAAADRRRRGRRLRHRAPAPRHVRPARPQEGDRRRSSASASRR